MLWVVTFRLHQSFLMKQNSANFTQYKNKQKELMLKIERR